MPFNTVAEIKTFLQIPSVITSRDDMISDLLDEVHGMILEDVGLSAPWATTSYTQAFDIREAGRGGIRLPKWPVNVTGGLTIYTGTSGGAAGALVVPSAYYVTEVGTVRLQDSLPASGQVSRAAYWPVGMQNVTVTWMAGYPEDGKAWRSLKLAEKLTVAELFNAGPSTGKAGEKIGSYSYTKASRGSNDSDVYPRAAARIISRYRTIIPGGDPVVP